VTEILDLVETAKYRRSLPLPATARAIRVQAGLSQGELGAALRVTRPTISRWESGLRCPRGNDLKAYAELLGALANELFG
jgi:transcriptional regulator with XRE-family HTH domain